MMDHRRHPTKYELKDINTTADWMAHANRCRIPQWRCPYRFCKYEKGRLQHLRNCQFSSRNCYTCWEVGYVLTMHARYCKRSICRVPNCSTFRQRMFTIASAA